MYMEESKNNDFYALEAKRIVRERNKQERENNLCYFKQKLIGLFIISISPINPFYIENQDVALLTLILGAYLIFTKKKVTN